ncbi:NAD(P)-dependent oxidoreductase [Paenibacillus selenitireducens]|uniref:dTDP-4-dehydrorhamnose reductase n=1 Tax=Paenibacillus selenitireducens TaxID=1324314 RepID=A0A1T2XJX6_9BACL|nr:SDR family oxidoreductase [Paenibacillus selenitireducens]OPA80170.1 NAD(P)-dependent oxidoreductase [Paenibacillus selenitireducens]
MKMLIIGGNGMAGHLLVRYFRHKGTYQVLHTTRDAADREGFLLDVTDQQAVDALLKSIRPDMIVNAVGVLNQAAEQNKSLAYEVNGLFPHRLRKLADKLGARLIHISTDCVFKGDRGQYSETDTPDAVSVYGRSKAVGEVSDAPHHLTIRTSIIGPEIRSECIGLLHWFMQQKGEVSGYRGVLWNGVTTLELARAVDSFALSSVSGLIHLVHPNPISKYELLGLFQEVFNKQDVKIVPDEVMRLDRTLINTRSDVQYDVPQYQEMLQQLADWERTQ